MRENRSKGKYQWDGLVQIFHERIVVVGISQRQQWFGTSWCLCQVSQSIMNMAMFAFDQEKFAGSVSKDPKRLILISTPFWAIDPKFHTVIED